MLITELSDQLFFTYTLCIKKSDETGETPAVFNFSSRKCEIWILFKNFHRTVFKFLVSIENQETSKSCHPYKSIGGSSVIKIFSQMFHQHLTAKICLSEQNNRFVKQKFQS